MNQAALAAKRSRRIGHWGRGHGGRVAIVDGTTIAADVESLQGTLLCARGQEVTPPLRARLKTYVGNVGIKEQIKVFVPEEVAD